MSTTRVQMSHMLVTLCLYPPGWRPRDFCETVLSDGLGRDGICAKQQESLHRAAGHDREVAATERKWNDHCPLLVSTHICACETREIDSDRN